MSTVTFSDDIRYFLGHKKADMYFVIAVDIM